MTTACDTDELRVLVFYRQLEKLNLDMIDGAPKFFGVHKKTVQRWLRGIVPIPDQVMMLTTLMLKTKTPPDTVRKFATLTLEDDLKWITNTR
jgi:hypothetical protein